MQDMEQMPRGHSFNPKALSSWARRTGFKSQESNATKKSQEGSIGTPIEVPYPELREGPLPKPPGYVEPKVKDVANGNGVPNANGKAKVPVPPSTNLDPETGLDSRPNKNSEPIRILPMRMPRNSEEIDVLSQSQDADDGPAKQSHMKYELREWPGIVPLIVYGLQHYFSIIGSIILVPLIIVPAMGGSGNDVARVVSTTFLVTGITTLLHLFFGTRLPLVQGASFVYLAPALVIINSAEFANLNDNVKFKHTMRELQGAVIISSIFQIIAGYSGFMSILLRVIHPVIVAPTVAAVGLAFFSYGFPKVGSCVEIGIPQIVLVIIFSLHLRKISIFGHRIFQVYAVSLGLAITWAYAFLLTEAGAYNYKGCKMSMANSKTLTQDCRRHIFTMMNCRTDASHALRDSAWIRFPYPFQWGMPTFRWQTGVVMIAASIIASVDSVGSYHATSLLVASRAPTRGVVSRGIGLEGIASVLAGMWGTGTGMTTLTENVHTIAVTRMGSRHPVALGACVLIVLSLIGKVGGFIASIPSVIIAALLCVMWAMTAAWGLSNLRYSETGSSRNVLIVGLSLFLSLSVPSYFQQYGNTNFQTSYMLAPYTVATHGPFKTSSAKLNYALNSILSMNMVIAFLVAFFLDNTVPGSRQERGVYVWSRVRTAKNDPAFQKDYSLPFGLWKLFAWVKWVGSP